MSSGLGRVGWGMSRGKSGASADTAAGCEGKARGRRRLDALRDQLLETPKMAVVNAQRFKVTDRAVEILGHRSEGPDRHGKQIRELLRGQSADIAAAVPVDHKGDRAERPVLLSGH